MLCYIEIEVGIQDPLPELGMKEHLTIFHMPFFYQQNLPSQWGIAY